MQKTPIQFLDDDEDDIWERAGECCNTEAGKLDPTFTATATVTDGGFGLTITGNSAHACGMKWVQLDITLTGVSGTVWNKFGLREPNFTLRNGPEANRKVPEQISRLDVRLTAFSVCGTYAEKNFNIILV